MPNGSRLPFGPDGATIIERMNQYYLDHPEDVPPGITIPVRIGRDSPPHMQEASTPHAANLFEAYFLPIPSTASPADPAPGPENLATTPPGTSASPGPYSVNVPDPEYPKQKSGIEPIQQAAAFTSTRKQVFDGVVIPKRITKKPADPTGEGANEKGKSPPAPIPHNLPEKVNPRRSAYIEEVPAFNDEPPTPQYKPVHPPSTKTSGPHAPVPISTSPFAFTTRMNHNNHPSPPYTPFATLS